jgi:hypothetical protein
LGFRAAAAGRLEKEQRERYSDNQVDRHPISAGIPAPSYSTVSQCEGSGCDASYTEAEK